MKKIQEIIKAVADGVREAMKDAIESGYFPFGKVISIGANGVRNILIMRKDYENWADQYLKEGT